MKPFLPPTIWALVIFGLSISPGIQMPVKIISADKLGHLFAYGVFNWLMLKALFRINKFSKKNASIAIIVVSSYGVALEFVQWAFFPYRFFEVWDMAANFAGAILGFVVFKFVTPKRKFSSTSTA